MIGLLNGKVAMVESDSAIIDCGGVGYEVLCSSNTIAMMEIDTPARLYIYTHVREDHLILFGFPTQTEKQVFLSLLKVNGIGPKMALTILSSITLTQFVSFIEEENSKALTKLPKVGKKTAEQMVLTLKGKLPAMEEGAVRTAKVEDAVISALSNLGYRTADIELVKDKFTTAKNPQEGIRAALQALSGGI